MAHRKMILTEAGAQFYRTRMLSAGDPVTLGARDARLFEKHGWAQEPPKRRAKVETPAAPVIPTVKEVLSAEVVQENTQPKRRGRRKKAAE